ncbi:MAG: 3'-5' exonuclease [Acidimicrobiaceae bacterium]|jgi:DNA polymerase III epsilon subunit-like protein|nr:3'-5' exonuclease [Acidimicrobiaceae bacterium]
MTAQRDAIARTLWRQTRLVVIDVETTGLQATSRMLAFAAYIVENGATIESWSTLMNPGTHIGATKIHSLTPEKLAGAKSFQVHSEKIRRTLTSSSKTTFVTGHNVSFDAERLVYEFRLLGEEPPPMLLLDNSTLAPATGVGTANSSSEKLAATFGLLNPAAHEANADAITTREVTLRVIDLLIDAGVSDLTPYAMMPRKRFTFDDEPDYELTPEHEALHALPLTKQAERENALAQCLALSCPVLNRRIEDGVTDGASARSLIKWSIEQIGRPGLTRYQVGLLMSGALRAMNGRRDLLVRPKPDLMLHNARALLNSYPRWEACTDDDQCDRCASGRPYLCRFFRTPINAVWSAMYNSEEQVPLNVAMKYLYGAAKTPLGASSWYSQLRALHPYAAVRGASRAARTLATLHRVGQAIEATEALWATELHTPGLTALYATLVEESMTQGERDTALRRALAICDEGLAGNIGERPWHSVEARRERLARRLAVAESSPFKHPYNQRPPHRSRFVRP